MILYAALDPSIASKAKQGEFVKCLNHFDLNIRGESLAGIQ